MVTTKGGGNCDRSKSAADNQTHAAE